jgi:hypothetical protein
MTKLNARGRRLWIRPPELTLHETLAVPAQTGE